MTDRELDRIKRLVPTQLLRRIKMKCQKGITIEIRRRSATSDDMNEDVLIALKELQFAAKRLDDVYTTMHNT